MRHAHRAAVLLAGAAIGAAIACVPATDTLDPRGAVGAIVEPSTAARGVPFETSDGWTVRIEALGLIATISATSKDVDASPRSEDGSGEGGAFVWSGAVRAELVVPALRVGAVDVAMALHGRTGNARRIVSSFESLHPDPKIVERLLGAPDAVTPDRGPPSFVLAGRGEKAGRVVVFDLTVRGDARSIDRTLEVRADEVSLFTVEVAAEQLFVADPATGGSSFDEFAEADRRGDDDGHVTDDEAKATSSTQGASLHDRIGARTARLLVRR